MIHSVSLEDVLDCDPTSAFGFVAEDKNNDADVDAGSGSESSTSEDVSSSGVPALGGGGGGPGAGSFPSAAHNSLGFPGQHLVSSEGGGDRYHDNSWRSRGTRASR